MDENLASFSSSLHPRDGVHPPIKSEAEGCNEEDVKEDNAPCAVYARPRDKYEGRQIQLRF